ncbi:MAG TPA: hypothetical protein VNZ54_00685 [bacterium]|nr:hypothetical protein [bacterium]
MRAYLAGRMLFAGADLAADAAKVWLAASPAGPAGGPLAMIRASEAWGHGALLGFLVVAYLGADGLIALAGRAADPAGDGRAEPLRLAWPASDCGWPWRRRPRRWRWRCPPA